MKKSYQTRHCLSCICENCGIEFLKPESEIKRNLNKGRKNFCSISCSVSYRNKNNPSEKTLTHRKHFIEQYTGLNKINNVSRLDEYSKFKESLRRAKMHAKQRKSEYTITLDDLKQQWEKQNGKCAYTNVELELPIQDKNNKFPPLTRQASLDRIDSSKGYIPNNIQFVCSCINLLKNRMTDLEVKRFLKEISSFTSTFIEDETISSSQNKMSDAQAGN